MSLLQALASDASIANETDSLGSSVVDSGLYLCTVAMAYINKASSGALGLVLTLKGPTGRDIRQTLWMTSGTAKGGNNYYTDKNGEKKFLPGFLHANSLALLTTGKEISQLDTETKVLNIYSAEAKAEVPTKAEVVMDLLGKEILVGIIKQTVDKTQKNDQGVYMPTGETREENEIDKMFRATDRMTTAEIRAQASEATFASAWETKWAGKTKDRSKGVSANSGTFGAPKAAAGTKKPAASLFG